MLRTVVTPRFRRWQPFLVSLRCGMLSSGLGTSVLTFFGERGPVVVGRGGGSEWSGTGRLSEGHLGAWRSARAGLGGLLGTDPSV